MTTTGSADTVAGQHALLARGATSAVELTTTALARAHDAQGRLHCFVRIDDDGALRAARDADRRRAAGEDGPLLGVPVAVKDDLDEAGEVTGWGSRATTRPALADAPSITALRRAGAVMVGRTTLPELAAFGVTDSAALGVTRHPDDPSRSPGGSSGGSAAAVAARVVAAATASDGAGSIRIPAACCGLVGLKPTAGTMPGETGWNGLATQGGLTHDVADAAALLDALGHDTPLTPAVGVDPRPLRIGVDVTALPVAAPLPLDPHVGGAVRRVADLLADLGHHVEPVRIRPGLAAPAVSLRILRALHDAAVVVDEPERLEARTRDLARAGGLVPPRLLRAARRHGPRWGARVLADLGVDVLLTPTMRGTAPEVGRWGGADARGAAARGGLSTLLGMGRVYGHTPGWNHSGQPAVSLPAGRHPDGLPLAVQFVAAHGRDALLVALGGQVERGIGFPP